MTSLRIAALAATALGGLTLTVAGMGVAVVNVVGSVLDYGADFDYPDTPPVPDGAEVVAEAEGWDDDDPMRGREIVIEAPGLSRADLLAFYRDHYSISDGWLDGRPDVDTGGGHLLCMVSHADEGYDEYVEVYPYLRGARSSGPARYLVSISRLDSDAEYRERSLNRCGIASIWFPSDL